MGGKKRHVKITNSKGLTKNNTQWGENVTHEIKVKGRELCSDQVFHGYKDEYLAVFFNPIHGDYGEDMLLWEAEGNVVANDGTKLGFKKQTTIKQIPIPKITTEQRTEIAIRRSLMVYKEESYKEWAENWLSGKDRAESAAWSARSAVWSAVWSARLAAESAAWSAAESAAWSAGSAAESAADESAARSAGSAASSA